jgi:hypothetical protein
LLHHEPYTDARFGTATWDNARGDWLFSLIFPSGRTADGCVRPADNCLHLSSPELEASRACVRWVQANELTLKQYVADKLYAAMLDGHNPDWGSPLTKE